MFPKDFIPESAEDFYVKKNANQFIPPIAFTMQVIATDVSPTNPAFKIKILLDFVPEFTTERNRDNPNFSGKGVRRILDFVSDKVLPKVLEYVYYDVSNGPVMKSYAYVNAKKTEGLPPGYDDVMQIYAQRREAKEAKLAKMKKDSKIREVNIDIPDPEGESIIEQHLEALMKKDAPHWQCESAVSRVTYTRLSEPRMTVEQRTAVNGDKKLPK